MRKEIVWFPSVKVCLLQLGKEAGVPEGVLNVLPADRESSAVIGEFLCSSPDVDAISFTGSTAVGKVQHLFLHFYLIKKLLLYFLLTLFSKFFIRINSASLHG